MIYQKERRLLIALEILWLKCLVHKQYFMIDTELKWYALQACMYVQVEVFEKIYQIMKMMRTSDDDRGCSSCSSGVSYQNWPHTDFSCHQFKVSTSQFYILTVDVF